MCGLKASHIIRDERERMYKLITRQHPGGHTLCLSVHVGFHLRVFHHNVLRFMLPTIDLSCNEYLFYMALVHCMNTIDSWYIWFVSHG